MLSGNTPTVTCDDPADITYGTPLGGPQLDATATFDGTNVTGTFTYSPAAGTILDAGQGQMLSVSFAPDDTADFNGTTAIRRDQCGQGHSDAHL